MVLTFDLIVDYNLLQSGFRVNYVFIPLDYRFASFDTSPGLLPSQLPIQEGIIDSNGIEVALLYYCSSSGVFVLILRSGVRVGSKV